MKTASMRGLLGYFVERMSGKLKTKLAILCKLHSGPSVTDGIQVGRNQNQSAEGSR
jgi:hypothetical protein